MNARRVARIESLVLASVLALGLASEARADVAPPNAASCSGKKAGESCKTDDGKPGACVQTACGRPGMERTCSICAEQTSGASSGGTSNGGSGTGPSNGVTNTSGGSSASGGSTTSSGSKSGCDVASGGGAGSASSFAVVVTALAWAIARRRRRGAPAGGR